MKKIFLLIIALIAFNSSFAQNKANIKAVLERLIDVESLPFYRTKNYLPGGAKIGQQRADGTIAKKTVLCYYLSKSNNYSGVPFYGYKDLNNSEFFLFQNIRKLNPNRFVSNMKFQSSKSNFHLVPFLTSAGGEYWEDVLVSCDKTTGDIADALLIAQAGRSNDEIHNYLFVRQWSINERGEITVYRLELTTKEKIYFNSCPEVINLKRTDTVYQIDDKGKFYQISKKEYKPKNYKREELFKESKNIWEGNEIVI